jgi:hypothetical protein
MDLMKNLKEIFLIEKVTNDNAFGKMLCTFVVSRMIKSPGLPSDVDFGEKCQGL